jgi:hypothetical protein
LAHSDNHSVDSPPVSGRVAVAMTAAAAFIVHLLTAGGYRGHGHRFGGRRS